MPDIGSIFDLQLNQHAANKDENSAIFSGGSRGGYRVQQEAPALDKPVEKAEIQDVQNAQKVSFSELETCIRSQMLGPYKRIYLKDTFRR